MTVEGNSMGGLTVGFESMISTVLPGSSDDLNAYTSVRSSRVSSPGNLRLSALKWFDMVAPLSRRADNRSGCRSGDTSPNPGRSRLSPPVPASSGLLRKQHRLLLAVRNLPQSLAGRQLWTCMLADPYPSPHPLTRSPRRRCARSSTARPAPSAATSGSPPARQPGNGNPTLTVPAATTPGHEIAAQEPQRDTPARRLRAGSDVAHSTL